VSLHDEPTDRLGTYAPPSRPELQAQITDRLVAVAPPRTISWSWRTATAAGLTVATVALYGYALLSRTAPPPPEHVNSLAGFSIEPPPGWTDRQNDRDGTFIRPGPDGDRRASLTVSTRLALDPDPRLALVDIQTRRVSGPIRDLRWLGNQQVQLDSGLTGILAEFTQTYRGVPMHGWAVLAVHEARLLHAVGVVPEERVQDQQLQLVSALHTLSPLLPDPRPQSELDE
jgi:hypothetical protein